MFVNFNCFLQNIQFDTNATAVIMTSDDNRDLYTNMVSGSQIIESSLHKFVLKIVKKN